MIAKPERQRFDTSHPHFVPRFAGRGSSLMPSATLLCRPATTVCSGACTLRHASDQTANWPSRATAATPSGSAMAPGNAIGKTVRLESVSGVRIPSLRHEFNIGYVSWISAISLSRPSLSVQPGQVSQRHRLPSQRPLTETVAVRFLVGLFADQICAWTVLRLLPDGSKNYGNLCAFAGWVMLFKRLDSRSRYISEAETRMLLRIRK